MGAQAGGQVSTTKPKSSAQMRVRACQETIPESSQAAYAKDVFKVFYLLPVRWNRPKIDICQWSRSDSWFLA